MCKAAGCKENHQKHFCGICQSKDSDHKSSQCPEGIDIYHGTRCDCVTSIIKDGLHPSAQGRIGPGIYFTEQKYAKDIADHRGNGSGVAVFKVRVNKNDCKQSMHPPWAGVKTDFPQWCLTTENYKILTVYLKNGVINSGIYAPSCKVYLSGNCKVKGNIKAKYVGTFGHKK